MFPRVVKVKSPHNVFFRRFWGVLQAIYLPERLAWALLKRNGTRVEVPADHLIHFGASVSFTKEGEENGKG